MTFNRIKFKIVFNISCFTFCGILFSAPKAHAAFSISAPETVKVGKQISIMTNGTNLSFQSADPTIATVNKSGVVTGKRPGKVKIAAINSKGKQKTVTVTVRKTLRKPNLPVTFDEIKAESEILQTFDGTGYSYRLRVKNLSNHKIRKLVYTYKVQVRSTDEKENKAAQTGEDTEQAPVSEEAAVTTKTVKLVIKNVVAGKTSAWRVYKGDVSESLEKIQLVKVELYAGDARYVSAPQKNSFTLGWGIPDTSAPVFAGALKNKSIYSGEPVIVYYSDRKDTYNFGKGITAFDEREGNVKIKTNTSDINWKKTGIYKVKFSASDSIGNTAKSWRKVQVIVPDTAENVADEVLASIIKDNWSNKKKAFAIYRYVRMKISYTIHEAHPNHREGGLHGIRYGYGDCYAFYSTSRLLLTRAGIPNLMVKRYPARPYRHFWNLVYVNGGWYHFDACPRPSGKSYCLLTDAQMHAREPGNTFAFDTAKYPNRSKKVISKGNPFPKYR